MRPTTQLSPSPLTADTENSRPSASPSAATVGKQGVDDVIVVDGAKTISPQNEQADIQEMIVSTNETVTAAGVAMDDTVGEALDSVRPAFPPPTIQARYRI